MYRPREWGRESERNGKRIGRKKIEGNRIERNRIEGKRIEVCRNRAAC